MTEGAWPDPPGGRLRPIAGRLPWVTLRTLVAYLISLRPARPLGPLGDAWTRTHVRARPGNTSRPATSCTTLWTVAPPPRDTYGLRRDPARVPGDLHRC